MYIVKNVSSSDVQIADLRISLKSNQQQDLDMICSRSIAEQSGDLKHAISRGKIKIVSKDGMIIGNKVKYIPDRPRKQSASIPVSDGGSDLVQEIRNLEKRLNERHDLMMKKHIGESKSIDSKTTETLNAAIDALKSLAGNSVPQQSKSEDIVIDDSKAIDIQKRVIGRVAKDAKGNIRSDDTKSKTDIGKNVDELGDLLG